MRESNSKPINPRPLNDRLINGLPSDKKIKTKAAETESRSSRSVFQVHPVSFAVPLNMPRKQAPQSDGRS